MSLKLRRWVWMSGQESWPFMSGVVMVVGPGGVRGGVGEMTGGRGAPVITTTGMRTLAQPVSSVTPCYIIRVILMLAYDIIFPRPMNCSWRVGPLGECVSPGRWKPVLPQPD